MSRYRMSISAVAFLTLLGTIVGASPALAVNTCGGDATDYTGVSGAIVPFTGNAVGAGVTRPMTVASTQLGGITLKTEITINGDVRSATGAMLLKVDTLGEGVITFPVFRGMARSTGVKCTGTVLATRVTQITGTVAVSDSETPVPFTVTRAAI